MAEDFSLEAALRELDEIVHQLESSEHTLDESLALFEKGQQLIKLCQQDLDCKELRIQQIMEDDSLASFDS
jgi:exodeoxyribonuclease VII small subunit